MNRFFDNMPLIGNKIPGKITLSFLMLLYAAMLFAVSGSVDRRFCLIAMLFSFVGDVALNHTREHEKQSIRDFVIGGLAFIVGHIFYCITYYTKIQIAGFKTFNQGSIFAIAILIMISIVMILKNASMSKSIDKLFLFGFLYLWITGINYITIFSYAHSVKSVESLAALGGLMFLVSDVIIGFEKFFNLRSPIARELVWWLYPLGQILLITMA